MNEINEDYYQTYFQIVWLGALDALRAKESAANKTWRIHFVAAVFSAICIVLLEVLFQKGFLPRYWFNIRVLMHMFSAFNLITFLCSAVQERNIRERINSYRGMLEPSSEDPLTDQKHGLSGDISTQIRNQLNIPQHERIRHRTGRWYE